MPALCLASTSLLALHQDKTWMAETQCSNLLRKVRLRYTQDLVEVGIQSAEIHNKVCPKRHVCPTEELGAEVNRETSLESRVDRN